MRRRVGLLLLVGVMVGLPGCIVLSPDYPGYPPAYPAPAYVPPPAPRPTPTPAPSAPGPQGGTAPSGKNCETVTVEGHQETRVMPGGQRETVWIPTQTRQICQ